VENQRKRRQNGEYYGRSETNEADKREREKERERERIKNARGKERPVSCESGKLGIGTSEGQKLEIRTARRDEGGSRRKRKIQRRRRFVKEPTKNEAASEWSARVASSDEETGRQGRRGVLETRGQTDTLA